MSKRQRIMDGYQYPNLTIIEEDEAMMAAEAKFQDAILAIFPKHESLAITVEDVHTAIRNEYAICIEPDAICRTGSDFIISMAAGFTRGQMLDSGVLIVSSENSSVILDLVPWLAEYTGMEVPAISQSARLCLPDINSCARASGELLRRLCIDISGIPTHIWIESLVVAVLEGLCEIRQVDFNPCSGMCIVRARSFCKDAIPATGHVAVKKDSMLYIWPIWLEVSDFTDEDDLHELYFEEAEAERLAEINDDWTGSDLVPCDWSGPSSPDPGYISGCSHHTECMCRYEYSDSSDDGFSSSPMSFDLWDREPRRY